MRDGLIRSARVVGVVGGITVSAVLLPLAINIATGGAPPAWWVPYRHLTWPAIILFGTIVAISALARPRSESRGDLVNRLGDPESNRKIALGRVERYVKHRLKHSLAHEARITLDFSERPEAVASQNFMVRPVGQEYQDVKRGVSVGDVFVDLGRSMLILGDPGSGKTNQLLELSEALIGQARDDESQPVPVVLDLSTWYKKDRHSEGYNSSGQGQGLLASLRRQGDLDFRDIKRWVCRELHRRYRFPTAVSSSWLSSGKIALLLDGLDEVAPELQERCVKALNNLVANFPGMNIAVSSRDGDYAKLVSRLDMGGAVSILPLERDTVTDYLRESGGHMGRVAELLERNPKIWEMLRTPLMLNILTIAATQPDIEYQISQSESNGAREVFDAYVCEVLGRRRDPLAPCGPRTSLRSLWFLANVVELAWGRVEAGSRQYTSRYVTSSPENWRRFVPAESVWIASHLALPGVIVPFCVVVTVAATLRLGAFSGLVVSTGSIVGIIGVLLFVGPRRVGRKPRRLSRVQIATFPITGVAVGGLGALLILALFRALSGAPDWLPAALSAVTIILYSIVPVVRLGVVAGVGDDLSVLHLIAGMFSGLMVLVLIVFLNPAIDVAMGWFLGIIVYALIGSVVGSVQDFSRGATGVGWGSSPVLWVGVIVLASALVVKLDPSAGGVGWEFGVGLLLSASTLPLWVSCPSSTWIGPIIFRFGGYLPPKRSKFLEYARDRSLLTEAEGDWRFVHLLVRDHLVDMDPDNLTNRVKWRGSERDRLAHEAEEVASESAPARQWLGIRRPSALRRSEEGP